MVQGLIDKGYAYEVEGDVYFRVHKDDDYGKLSRRKLEDMESGYRIDADTRKESPMDFALWKAAKPGEPAWDSPWGLGRPGWHIECSVMSLEHLGEQIDIHGGGNDLVFPHHENEIAQSESYTGKSFANYWMHNGMMQLSGEKMSKSLGNLVTIGDFLADHEADVLRMMILNSSYRSPLTFSDEVIEQTHQSIGPPARWFAPGLPGSCWSVSGGCWKPFGTDGEDRSQASWRRWTMISTPPGRWATCSTWCAHQPGTGWFRHCRGTETCPGHD